MGTETDMAAIVLYTRQVLEETREIAFRRWTSVRCKCLYPVDTRRVGAGETPLDIEFASGAAPSCYLPLQARHEVPRHRY